ncbi:ATP-dependent DNA helicase Q1-like isoform X2 [Hydractinia symbiolongicarpus]|uniref:ATP-dependent DNA helicase Q1-like isoform X2 n=1 Tax=Hydractinia symbiolongicarpus TaxID=13093 RepID=UPI00254F0626|nr:ATP-dependent DNA helicase Q1-like isoform X2 [Hydractinia symbiolongicarpus]
MSGDTKSEIVALQMEIENMDNELHSISSQLNMLITKQENLTERKKKLTSRLNNLKETLDTPTEEETDWSGDHFEWSENIKKVLKNKFHIGDFRQLQKETINVTMSKRDCILIMPTGGGKSLCFQLPAFVSDGFTLVISPLISLMEDQLIALKALNIEATTINSSSPLKYVTEVQKQMAMKECPFKILYVTPEKIAKSKRFMAKLEKAYSIGNISRIVIDEVHCASHWGHDFRPDYKILGILKRQFPNVPLLGLTATASEKVLTDVKDILNLDGSCVVFRASFNRPNLYYEVYKTSSLSADLIQEIASRIKTQFTNMSGIIYCFSRKDSEDVANKLVQHGIQAHCYHADLQPELKSKIHRSWTKGNLQVVVATIAFGMGIDKPNVRFVIHYSISKSMENYYQESGRAGRDDKKAWCILYFRFQDIFRQSSMVFTEKTGIQNLYNMLRYCIDQKNCRRTQIGEHFEENWSASKCHQMCDNCQPNREITQRCLKANATTIMEILRNASSSDERVTPLKVIDAWLGKAKVSLRPESIATCSRSECESVVTKLLIQQIVQEDYHFTPYSTVTYLIPGPRWLLLKRDQISVKLDIVSEKNDIISGESTSGAVKKLLGDNKETSVKTKKRKAIVIDSDCDEDVK